jgi:sugar lactone lactonase YvrE
MPADAPELILDARAALGEGPSWDAATRSLLWVDILAGRIHVFDHGSGRDRTLDVGRPVGAAIPAEDGRILACLQGEVALVDRETGVRELVAPLEPDVSANRANDAKCDTRGRLWLGTMAFDAAPNTGTLYRLDLDGPTPVVERTACSNGIAWSPDDRTMYYIDSMAGGVDAFDYDVETGAPSNRRRLIDVPDEGGQLPDGMCVDADGYLWFCVWEGARVERRAPDGRLDRVVELPVRRVTSCCFGGPELDCLFVTTARSDELEEPGAGGVFSVAPGVRGLPTNQFRPPSARPAAPGPAAP